MLVSRLILTLSLPGMIIIKLFFIIYIIFLCHSMVLVFCKFILYSLEFDFRKYMSNSFTSFHFIIFSVFHLLTSYLPIICHTSKIDLIYLNENFNNLCYFYDKNNIPKNAFFFNVLLFDFTRIILLNCIFISITFYFFYLTIIDLVLLLSGYYSMK